MDTVTDFEDFLVALSKHEVRYLTIGGLAFIYHAKPRFTKDLDVWVDPDLDNIERANAALADFGSPHPLSPDSADEILQPGLPPNRIDLLLSTGNISFADAWARGSPPPSGSRAPGPTPSAVALRPLRERGDLFGVRRIEMQSLSKLR